MHRERWPDDDSDDDGRRAGDSHDDGCAAMGLTSGSFLVVIFGIAIAGILATILLWPYAAKRRIGAVIARIVMIVVSQVLVIAAFLVVLNGYFGFYASWSQLIGSGTTTQTFGSAKAASAAGPPLTITAAAPGPLPGAPVQTVPALAAGQHGLNILGTNLDGYGKLAQTGELLGIAINGARTGIAVSGDYVYLPPQYFQPAYAHAKFPAVLALTGYPVGSAWSIIKRLKIPGTAAALMARK